MTIAFFAHSSCWTAGWTAQHVSRPRASGPHLAQDAKKRASAFLPELGLEQSSKMNLNTVLSLVAWSCRTVKAHPHESECGRQRDILRQGSPAGSTRLGRRKSPCLWPIWRGWISHVPLPPAWRATRWCKESAPADACRCASRCHVAHSFGWMHTATTTTSCKHLHRRCRRSPPMSHAETEVEIPEISHE